jgi:hypothetical protein
MKFLFPFALAMVFSSFLYGQETDTKTSCSVLKQGKFRYLDIDDTTAYFEIDKEDHTEYHNGGKYFIKSRLRWITDCQYEMTMLKNTIPDFPFKPGDVMIVAINKVEGDIINYTSEVNGYKWDGRLLKVKK